MLGSAQPARPALGSAQPARPALGLAGEGIPIGSFWFGSDLPPVRVPLDGPIETLNALGLSDSDLEGVRWRNAARCCRLSLDG